MNFQDALTIMKGGPGRCYREAWGGDDQWVEAQRPDEHSKMSHPYLFIRHKNGSAVPWVVSQDDLFALDWKEIVEL